MSRRLLARIPLFRTIVPRLAAPILPTARPGTTPLTQTSRTRLSPFASPSSRPFSSKPPDEHAPLPPNASLSARLKHLIKAYGWYALGVYLLLSVADFSVAFAAVNVFGAERVSAVAGTLKETALSMVSTARPPEPGKDELDPVQSRKGNEGLYAMIVLAYTIHKTLFLPVRVGLTAGLTPKLVNWLRARGWAGGAGTRRAASEMRERATEMRDRIRRRSGDSDRD
ncbi:uncharacterized protein SCHCODRAFT_02633037 [Schizophyllum commune H4-8]|uniref:DUF1279 domain-containing protein n=1 Tax=Schizophyllum commune (strain H4-8 / FGSC 9210) TaxID=578458 RepID=D8QAS9_SCHCM|nr:uncharacterized protein SCHCODRAFT_02633037 [Schizophyllum commune H4-8]KAI5890864.1 hypothetical protein SCHCODRAFT_02633037 [Schizophyllum commune H4-8]